MKAIIPVAGSGTRLSPITDSKPKPLIEVAGAPVLEHIINNLVKSGVDELVLIVGVMKDQLITWTKRNYENKIRLFFVVQDEPMGLGHAIFQAEEFLSDEEVLITIGDAIFSLDFSAMLDEIRTQSNIDASVGTMIVENPSHWGMVEVGDEGLATRMVEKPKSFDGKDALAGSYYIKKGTHLRSALSDLLRRDFNGIEYQVTDALQMMIERGHRIGTYSVGEYYDCGRPETLLTSNYQILATGHCIDDSAMISNSDIIEPCFIAKNAIIEDSKIGPYVSVGKNVKISDSIISQSIIEENSVVTGETMLFTIRSGDLSIERPEMAI
ncbi:MAG: sugar phosphate nucleotidyltransferase [Candidatus Thorarchaeota archaeon]